MNERLFNIVNELKEENTWINFSRKCGINPGKLQQAINSNSRLTESEVYLLWKNSNHQYSYNEILTSCGYKIKKDIIIKGEIYWFNFGQTTGSIQGGLRPVVIISNNINNKFSSTVQIAPISSQVKNNLPCHVKVSGYGLSKNSVVLTEQIKTINKSELKDFIGFFNKDIINQIDEAIMIQFGVKKADDNDNKNNINNDIISIVIDFINIFTKNHKMKNPDKVKNVFIKDFQKFCQSFS